MTGCTLEGGDDSARAMSAEGSRQPPMRCLGSARRINGTQKKPVVATCLALERQQPEPHGLDHRLGGRIGRDRRDSWVLGQRQVFGANDHDDLPGTRSDQPVDASFEQGARVIG